MMRRTTRCFHLGRVGVGCRYPVSIQSMTTIPVQNVADNLAQISRLRAVGCDIVRLAFDRPEDREHLREIVARSELPIVADIQFSADSALAALQAGVAGIRLNPGLLRDEGVLRPIAEAALERAVPIRVGANSGSIGNAEIRRRTRDGATLDQAIGEALVAGALAQCRKLEKFGVRNIKVALKASSVAVTVAACRRFAAETDYPLHLGVTEAGTAAAGSIKSAIGIGSLLLDGIGDTIRVSLTAPPEDEVKVARRILGACNLRDESPEIISCPGCGRTEVDLPFLVDRVERLVADLKANGVAIAAKRIAVMGCPVNGPGEAKTADLGVAGSRNGERLVLFSQGRVLGAFPPQEGLAKLAELLTQRPN